MRLPSERFLWKQLLRWRLLLVAGALAYLLFLGLSASCPSPAEEDGDSSQDYLITLKINRLGANPSTVTTHNREGILIVAEPNNLAYNFVPTVIGARVLLIQLFRLLPGPDPGTWTEESPAKPIEEFEIGLIGPHFTTAIGNGDDYRVEILSVEELD